MGPIHFLRRISSVLGIRTRIWFRGRRRPDVGYEDRYSSSDFGGTYGTGDKSWVRRIRGR